MRLAFWRKKEKPARQADAGRRRALVVANDFTTVYHFRMELVERLLGEGWRVSVALPADGRNGALSGTGAEVVEIRLSRFGTNPLAELKTLMDLLRAVRRLRPAVALTYTAKPNIYGGLACTLTRTPYVCTVTGLGKNFDAANLVSGVMVVLQRIGMRRARRVFFQNAGNMERLQSAGVARHNAALVPGSGVNLGQNPAEPYPGGDVTKFLTVSRVRQDKGFDELFAVARAFAERGLPAEFHVVGWYEDESYREAVRELSGLGNVVFHGEVPHGEIHPLYAACHALVHPSWHEGMSNVCLEAAATGRPVIGSRVPGVVETLDEGVSGLGFEPRDAKSLADALERFLALPQDKRRAMGLAAREKAEREFDRKLVVDRYMAEIERATGLGPKRSGTDA